MPFHIQAFAANLSHQQDSLELPELMRMMLHVRRLTEGVEGQADPVQYFLDELEDLGLEGTETRTYTHYRYEWCPEGKAYKRTCYHVGEMSAFTGERHEVIARIENQTEILGTGVSRREADSAELAD